jgi:iron(III) transport system substrate-binding protein
MRERGEGARETARSSWLPARRRALPLCIPTFVAPVPVGALWLMSRGLARRATSVVVYTAQDQVYSEPILRAFERETGIRVRAVYDSEAVKTVGLVNRLLAEKAQPQCDVLWNNEELRVHQLAARGVLADDPPWERIGYRSRRIVVNTNRLDLADAPRSLLELTNTTWRGRIAMAYPLFGTTATHILALRQHWGETTWREWCRALQANQPLILDGNSVVVRMVGRGEAVVGLTDSDDIAAGQREGYPITGLPLTEESLLIPNTVAVVRGAPRPESARRLADWLQQPAVVLRLVDANALESMSPPDPADDVPGLRPDWPALLERIESDTVFLKEVFLR